MKKIKNLILAFIAVIGLAVLSIGAKAETTVSWSTNDASITTSTTYAKSATVYDGTYLSVACGGNKALKVSTNKSAAVAENDSTLSFANGLWTGSSTKSAATALITVTSKVAGAKIGIWYTISNSAFTTTDQSKSGYLDIATSDGTSQNSSISYYDASTATADKANTTAYYAEYTINAINTTVSVYSSANNLVVFGFVESQGETSVEYNFNIKETDGTVIKTLSVTENTAITYEPTKWGYDFDGYFSDEELNSSFDASAGISAETNVYVKWEAWTFEINSYNVDSNLMSKLGVFYGTAVSAETAINGTIYSLLSSVNCTTNYISTNGGVLTSAKGVKIVVPASGVLTVSIGSGGTSARNAKLIDSSNNEITAESGTVSFDGSSYDPNTVTYNLSAGTYYLGGSNGMRIYSMSFAAYTAEINYQYNDTFDAVRFVGTISNIDIDNIASVQLVLTTDSESATNDTATIDITTLYTAITDLEGKDTVAEDIYYSLFTLTEVGEMTGTGFTATLNVTLSDDTVISSKTKSLTLFVEE